MSESAPSIMRAPPEQDTTISGIRPRERGLDGADDLFAHDDPHAAADERVLHRPDDRLDAVDAARRRS